MRHFINFPRMAEYFRELVNDKIHHLYVLVSSTLPCTAMCMLVMPLEEQLSRPFNTKILWVESIEAAILHKAQHDHGVMVGEQ